MSFCEVLCQVTSDTSGRLYLSDVNNGRAGELFPPDGQLPLWDIAAVNGQVQVWVAGLCKLNDSDVTARAAALCALDSLPKRPPAFMQLVERLSRRKRRVNPYG